MRQKYFLYPFGTAGDLTTIPDPTQISGAVSSQSGWTYNYQRQIGVDPLAMPIDRAELNYLFNCITSQLKQYQEFGVPEWITSANNGGTAFAYDFGAVVRYSATGNPPFTTYVSVLAGSATNTSTPGADANWLAFIPTGRQPHLTKITTSGNFTTAANITAATVFKITLVGGGAGGGGSNGPISTAGGGGAGGAVSFLISGLSPNTSYAVVIGSSGTAGNTSGSTGGDGGTTQITINGVVYSASGGLGGAGSLNTQASTTSPPGTPSASILALPNIVIYPDNSASGFCISGMGVASPGGSAIFGRGGYGGFTNVGTGVAGAGYGSGGGGGLSSAAAGGSGTPGLFIAEWVA